MPNTAVCTRTVTVTDDKDQELLGFCGALATYHLLWTSDGDCSPACEEHALEAIRIWRPVQVHKIAPACVSPQGAWDLEEKRCVVPEHPSLQNVGETVRPGQPVAVAIIGEVRSG